MAKAALGGKTQKATEERKDLPFTEQVQECNRAQTSSQLVQSGEQEIPGKGKAVGKIIATREDSVKTLVAPPG